MRAREMHNKLDRLLGSVDDDEQTCPDISLLSPGDQYRVHELLEKIRGADDVALAAARRLMKHDFLANIKENTITEAELRELSDLFAELPLLGPGEGFKGPSYGIPLELCSYFTHFRRRRMKVSIRNSIVTN
jgi:hypothetical protein